MNEETYTTPQEAIDAILANPPLGVETPPPDSVADPAAGTGAFLAEEHAKEQAKPHMSKAEAMYILVKLATSRRINEDGVTALQMGACALAKRHFERQRNWARRRAANEQEAK